MLFRSDIRSNLIDFPETFAERRKRLEKEADDPYGLQKLREMLLMFRELAGTKEIISTNTQKSDFSSRESRSSESDSNSSQSDGDWFTYLMIFIGLLTLILFLAAKYAKANRDASMMVNAAEAGKKSGGFNAQETQNTVNINGHEIDPKEIQEKLWHQELKDELTQIFIGSPKVAKETFTRLLQEEGTEETAKYVFIFGKMIIFELLSDPNLQRNLYELSEYYHKSSFEFSLKDEIALLQVLKTKVTANEIKVLAKKSIDQFDFLAKLDAPQIFELMSDEKPQIQSIILTQISPKRRKIVFELFTGKARMNLMNELCKADAIPREFLYNVALALSKKVSSKPAFDAQSLRSSDIILELLEKASLFEQKVLMKNLNESNLEAAKAIKLKLVSIETLPFLKDGHLLELVLGMERDDLLNFLAGSPVHIRDLLLSHAPEELAESWAEDLNNISGVEDNTYRLVELKILGKVRHLATNGAISLLEINEMIFSNLEDIEAAGPGAYEETSGISKNNLVA